MISFNIKEFRSGLKIIFDSEPCIIIKNEFVKPGKGQAFSRVRLRKLISGRVLEKIFKSSDFIEAANVIDIVFTFLYNDGEFWYFMNNENFEQLVVNSKVVAGNAKWLIEQTECILTLWNNNPITVMLPNFVELEIMKTEPGLKGDTACTSSKLAILTTGAIVRVPLFIEVGEVIKVNTRSGEYVSRIR